MYQGANYYSHTGAPQTAGPNSYYPPPPTGTIYVPPGQYGAQPVYASPSPSNGGYPFPAGVAATARIFQGDSVAIGVPGYAAPPASEEEMNTRIWSDPQSWKCGFYAGKGDTRFWVPNPDYDCCGERAMERHLSPNKSNCRVCICRKTVPNHAHPTYRKIVAVVFAIVVVSNIIRYIVFPRYT